MTANNTDFMYYKSGVLTSCGVVGARITHAVTLVGYKINYSG